MAIPDINLADPAITDDELDEFLQQVSAELDRRRSIAWIPQQIEEMSERYFRATGKQPDLPIQAADRGVRAAGGKPSVEI